MNTPSRHPVRKFVIVSSITLLALSGLAFLLIPSTLRGIFSTSFLPHAYCYLQNKQLIALHVTSDTLIWLSYVAISCTLVYLVWRTRREVPFTWLFLAFGLFIVACGFTHLMEVIVLWHPLYWLAGDVKLITAVASVVTAIALPTVIPQIHEMVTAAQLSENRRMQLERANTELQQLSTRVMSAQDLERRRIARELHDGIGQYLTAIKMSCEVALGHAKHSDQAIALESALRLLDRSTTEVRTMSHLLHPPLLEEIGLASAVPWFLEGFTERSGISVTLDMPSALEKMPLPIEIALFRVLQESLTNIHRHSGSKFARVQLRVEESRARLLVEDHGKGIRSDSGHLAGNGGNGATVELDAFRSDDGFTLKTGVGIASMRERMRELQGELLITSRTTGTIVEAVVPLKFPGEA